MVSERISVDVDSSGATRGAQEAIRAMDGITDSANEAQLAEIRAEQSAQQRTQSNMPGYNGTSQINSQNRQSLGQYSGSLETVNEIARLKATIENLNRNIEKANDEISKANENGDARGTYNWTASLNQMEESKQRAQNELRRLETEEQGKKNKGIDALIKDRAAQLYSSGWNYAIQGANIYNGYRTSIANGDYLGAGINAKDQIGGAAMGIGSTLMSAGGMIAATGAGAIPGAIVAGVGGVATGIGGILKLIAGDEKADNAEASAYEKSLPYLHAFNKRYVNGGSAESHTAQVDSLRERVSELAKGTSLSNYDFMNATLQQASYGVSKEQALSRTRMAALWANSTGADLGTIQDVLGLSSRMGKETDTGFLSRAREASGLTKAQTTEFLQGLQTVVEDGISNGYNKSTEDAAKNFAMFSSLSDGNPLWEGKYATQKISTISNSIAGATSLGDINQVLTIDTARQVADGMSNDRFKDIMGFNKTGTYLDAMVMAENGLTPDMFRGIGKTIDSLEGGNYTSRIERWKSISGLNYKGAIELESMYRNNPNISDNEIGKRIKDMQEDKSYWSEETKKQDAINRIDTYVQKIGQSKFWDNYDKLLGVEEEQRKKANSEYTDNTGAAEVVMENASSLETAREASKKASEYAKEVHTETAEQTVKNNVATSIATQVLSEAGDYTGAAKAVLAGEKGLSLANTYGFQNTQDTFFGKLRNESIGKDDVDNKTMEMIGKYAAFGQKKGGLFGIGMRVADGVVDEGEVADAVNAMERDLKLKKYYNSGDDTAYFNRLAQILASVLGNISVTESTE